MDNKEILKAIESIFDKKNEPIKNSIDSLKENINKIAEETASMYIDLTKQISDTEDNIKAELRDFKLSIHNELKDFKTQIKENSNTINNHEVRITNVEEQVSLHSIAITKNYK